MRLKPAGIIVIVLIIAVLGYFALRPRLADIRSENGKELSTTATHEGEAKTNEQTGNASNTKTTTAASGTERREFNYTPQKPENGTKRGVVEVGATGFNSFV